LLSLNHYVATPLYIYMQSKYPEKWKECEAAARK
jgi:hypothetical protein